MQNAPFPAPESMSHFYIVIAVALLICGLCVALAVVYIRLYKKLKAESQARQVALAELEENERNFRFITENSADVIWTMDIATGKFTYVSPSVYNLRGYTVEEVMRSRLRGDDAGVSRKSIRRVSACGRALECRNAGGYPESHGN